MTSEHNAPSHNFTDCRVCNGEQEALASLPAERDFDKTAARGSISKPLPAERDEPVTAALDGAMIGECPTGCGCRIYSPDADPNDCGCDGICTATEFPAATPSVEALAEALDAVEWHKWQSPQIDRVHTVNLARAVLSRLSPEVESAMDELTRLCRENGLDISVARLSPPTDTAFREWSAECAATHPHHLNRQCGCRRGDEIHGPPSECSDQPCINPAAHHEFVPPTDTGAER